MDEYFCLKCTGFGSLYPQGVQNKIVYAKKEMICPRCAAHIQIGKAVIKVSGHISEEVKDVSSHLVRQMNDAQIEREKLNNKKLLQEELSSSGLKLFLIGGCFWLGAFCAVFYMIFSLAIAQINWYRFIGALFGLPIFFTILGAFILRTTSQISETNFIQLVKLTLNLNFKGLKFLSKAQTEEDSRSDE